MNATAREAHAHEVAPAELTPHPTLKLAVATPPRRVARSVAGYAAGMAIGFALAAAASVPGGLTVVAGQTRLVLVAAAVAGAAALVHLARRPQP